MPESSDWLAYTGAITGVVGAVTGIAGAITGWVAYRRTSSMKALDLRVEARKLLTALHALLGDLQSLHEKAGRSHEAVAAATGGHNSGAMVRWNATWDADNNEIVQLAASVPGANEQFVGATETELENILISLHAQQAKAVRLHEKYIAELAADDKKRDQLRAATQARQEARRSLD